MIGSVVQDVRHAARGLLRSPGFALSTVLILAAGIAASTGLFAVIEAVALNPFPYAGAERIAQVRLLQPSGAPRPAAVTAGELRLLQGASTLDAVYARESFTKTLAGAEFPESVWTEYYTGNALRLLGVRPLLGRVFTESDAPLGGPAARVAVLTHPFWRRYFAGDPAAIGRTLRLDGEPFTVIGVLPPEYSRDLTDIVLPLSTTEDPAAAWLVMVRVRADASLERAEAELQRYFERFAELRAAAVPEGFRVQLRRLVDEERAGAHVSTVGLLFIASVLLLIIGCADVTFLLLARGRHRVRDLALRQALGAGRFRLVNLLLVETVLLTLAAAALAVVLLHQILPVLLAAAPDVVSQRAGRIAVGAPALVFAASLSAIVVLLAGMWPAVAVSRAGSHAMRRAFAPAGASAGRAGANVLIAAQVGVAVLLLAGTGAAIRTLLDLYRAPAGYDPARVTVAQIHLPVERYTSWVERAALYQRVRAEMARVASVESATIGLIPTGPPPRTGVSTLVTADGSGDDGREVLAHSIASDYFSTLRIPLVRGRMWTSADDARGEAVAVINEAMARQLWPGEDPVGKRVRDRSFDRPRSWIVNAPGRDGWFDVIGVVRDTPNRGLLEPVAPAFYYPYTAALSDIAVLVVRTRVDPAVAERDLRAAVARADGTLPIIRFITPDTFTARPQGQFVAAVLVGFAGMALVLAFLGLFSVVSCSVAYRTREFAIRMAVGAARGTVLRSAIGSAVAAVAVGVAAGMAGAAVLNSALARWSIRRLDDPAVLAAVAGTFAVVALAATLIPGRRALSIAPAAALKAE